MKSKTLWPDLIGIALFLVLWSLVLWSMLNR